MYTNLQLQKVAGKYGFAIPHFNVDCLEVFQAIIACAQKLESPVILGASEGEARHIFPEYFVALAQKAERTYGVKLSLHLDHGHSLETAEKCLKAGFSSVMLDGSSLSLEENIKLTREAVRLAHESLASCEGELGIIPNDKSVDAASGFTDPEQAAQFVAETGVDTLAIAIGTKHGPNKGQTKINWSLLEILRKKINCPLVLHGGSGLSEDEIQKAIKLGISKININTEIRLAASQTIKNFIQKDPQAINLTLMLGGVKEAVEKIVSQKIQLLGSAGKSKLIE
ncbi:tagatose-bisphosphate aldolase [Candidatus Peregrinibacteria bacterium CG08_land_8_20_14_0_20_41_10]|nr:MAG: tagatose-bisphosphate aldolase [Candidatus Peregrinibacteria bacterium CG08_land_8_20_14_0_20_41_10]